MKSAQGSKRNERAGSGQVCGGEEDTLGDTDGANSLTESAAQLHSCNVHLLKVKSSLQKGRLLK